MNKKHFFTSFFLAIQTFRHTKMRTFLTVFGIMVGIAMVIIVLSLGRGIKGLILSEVSSFGDNWINIEVKIPSTGKSSQENSNGLASGVTITTLTQDDMREIQTLSNIENAYAGITTQAVVSYAQEKERPTIFGVSPSYYGIDKTEVEKGRFFSEEENQSASQVAVLGSDIAETFFGNQDPLEKNIKVDGKAYRVVGVMESIGSTGFVNMDETVYLPVTTVQKKLMGIDYVLWIVAQTKDNTKAESTAEEIRSLMREQHNITTEGKEDFAVTTMNEALAIVETILIGITGLLIVLASISLIVGGVGIMNVMYVSVVERTFEIGLRKAVGARDKDILYQFLTEAVCLTLLGGIGGIIFGIGVSYMVALIASVLGFDWQFEVSIFSVLLSVIFCISVGLFFGLYPARQAAQLDPVVALRKE